MSETSRRSFITGLVSFVAAPAIVRAGSLMPVKVTKLSNQEIARIALDRIERMINPPYGLSPAMQALSWLEERNGIIRRQIILPEQYLVQQ